MASLPDLSTLPFLALYAETHFRFFRGFPSLLFRKWPEAVFDAPRRLDPGRDLPVTLVLNDLRRFPVKISDCSIVISQKDRPPRRFDFADPVKNEIAHPQNEALKAYVFTIPRNGLPRGKFFINACTTLIRGDKKSIVLNDNLPTSSGNSFVCVAAEAALPGSLYCCYGDLHIHSLYSQSHVEFGPPIQLIDAAAHASGLSFVAITDHSYDLAYSKEDYLAPDPSLTKWRLYQDEVHRTGDFKTMIIPGEEVSCLNEKKEVVHLGALGIKDFLPGTLDGARKGRTKEPQLSLQEALDKIHAQGGLGFAAHPGAKAGFLSRLLLYRGIWHQSDLANDIDGMQILNSGYFSAWDRGKALWIGLLASGRKIPLLGGNDAHGDFNRYRATGVPFLSLYENPDRYMGFGKTGIYGRHSSIPEIIEAIRQGKTFVTTGPFAGISATSSSRDSVVSNTPLPLDTKSLFVNAESSEEFGQLTKIVVCAGNAKNNRAEKVVLEKSLSGEEFAVCEEIKIMDFGFKPLYVRAEVSCAVPVSDSITRLAPARAFTSAVYFEK